METDDMQATMTHTSTYDRDKENSRPSRGDDSNAIAENGTASPLTIQVR